MTLYSSGKMVFMKKRYLFLAVMILICVLSAYFFRNNQNQNMYKADKNHQSKSTRKSKAVQRKKVSLPQIESSSTLERAQKKESPPKDNDMKLTESSDIDRDFEVKDEMILVSPDIDYNLAKDFYNYSGTFQSYIQSHLGEHVNFMIRRIRDGRRITSDIVVLGNLVHKYNPEGDNSKAINFLNTYLEHKDTFVQEQAIRALLNIGGAGIKDALFYLYDSRVDKTYKMQMLTLVSRHSYQSDLLIAKAEVDRFFGFDP